MKHTTKITKYEQVTDEMLMVEIACCEDSRTASRLSIYGIHKRSSAEVKADVDAHHARVAAKHAGMLAGKAYIAELETGEVEHEL